VYPGSIPKVIAALSLLSAIGCGSGSEEPRPIGEAFAGPAALKIRADIPLQSAVVATVKHGDRLELLGRRRRFFRVRTPSGAIGWTDERQLLGAQDMADLRNLASQAAGMPSQGVATTFSDLNVHTLPARQAPSFLQIRETDKIDVLYHLSTPRVSSIPSRPLIPPAPKKQAKLPAKPPKLPKYPPPPMPKAPPPPEDWLALSRTDLDSTLEDPPEESEPPKPVPMDAWSLIRTATGQSGWVLTTRLFMAIPDEVAQYAEGHRIVAYFALGEVQDGDQRKKTWLWTTAAGPRQPWDFDGFRVFVWNPRRHRYETAYIERNLQGYLPVLVHEVQYAGAGRPGASASKFPGFSVCVEKDGVRKRREFAYLGNIVRSAGDRPCEARVEPPVVPGSTGVAANVRDNEPAKPGPWERIKSLFGRRQASPAPAK
jgi:hypothetical protein